VPNPIKYTTGSETLALKKGNFYIGTGAVGKGPSDTTGYYQGPSVPSNGYVIYMNKVGAPGELSYHSAANDSELISFTNSLAGESFTTVTQCFNYYYGQTDKVLVTQDYPADFPYIVLDGLIFYLDAEISQSYPGSGTVWTDINGLGPKNNGTLINGPTFSGGSIVFDGVNDRVSTGFSILSGVESTIQISVKPIANSFGYYIAQSAGAVDGEGRFLISTTGTLNDIFSLRIGSNTLPTTGGFNQWFILTVTRNSNGLTTFYKNGIIVGTFTNTTPFVSGRILDIGGSTYVSGRTINGSIGNVLIYNRALTATEVLQNYNAQKGRFGL
jgi:hypothetical protein